MKTIVIALIATALVLSIATSSAYIIDETYIVTGPSSTVEHYAKYITPYGTYTQDLQAIYSQVRFGQKSILSDTFASNTSLTTVADKHIISDTTYSEDLSKPGASTEFTAEGKNVSVESSQVLCDELIHQVRARADALTASIEVPLKVRSYVQGTNSWLELMARLK